MRGESKYHNKSVIFMGERFDSKKEAVRYYELDMLQRAGIISDLRRQVKYELTGKNEYFKASHYIADFVYTGEDGKQVVEDVKGYKKGAAYDLFKIKQKVMYDKYSIVVREV